MKAKLCFLIPIIIIVTFVSYAFIYFDDYYIFPRIPNFSKMPINKNNKVTNSGVTLGRFLFYDPILSQDSTLSCSSCHQQNKAFSYSYNYRSIPSDERLRTKFNVLPLFNLAWSKRFFWDGRVKTIEDLVYIPIKNEVEMNSDFKTLTKRLNRSVFYKSLFEKAFHSNQIDSVMIAKAIGQFLRTLLSYNSKYDQVMRGEQSFNFSEKSGLELMKNPKKGNCFSCHHINGEVVSVNETFANNGLYSEFLSESSHRGRYNATLKKSDIGKFKVPSLRNLNYTEPYMHDGSLSHLDFVLDFYSKSDKFDKTKNGNRFTHHISTNLSPLERRNIIAFLGTLNDSVFIQKKEFGNPFIE